MELDQLLSFISASVLLTLMPGPDNIFVITESLTSGKRKGLFIAIGLSLGIIVHTTAAATGLSLILNESALAFGIVKYLGAAYLLYLAFKAFQDKPINVEVKEKPQTTFQPLPLIRKGFFMNVLNPKVSLFFIAFLPQFVTEGKLQPVSQMLVLGFVFMLSSLTIFSVIACLANVFTPYLNNPRFWKITKVSKILTFGGLAIFLTASSR